MYDKKQIDTIKQWLGSGAINIFGRPFSGKDSQGKVLAELFNGNLVGGGEIFRGDLIPEKIKNIMSAGKLVPSEDYISIVLPYFKQPQLANKPLILSSAGRWSGEENNVIDALKLSNHPLKAVIYLRLSDDESRNRWKMRDVNNDRKNRHDDTEDLLDVRFKEFREKTIPVLEHYRDLGLLVEVNGINSRDQVTIDILNALAEFSTKNQ